MIAVHSAFQQRCEGTRTEDGGEAEGLETTAAHAATSRSEDCRCRWEVTAVQSVSNKRTRRLKGEVSDVGKLFEPLRSVLRRNGKRQGWKPDNFSAYLNENGPENRRSAVGSTCREGKQ